MENAGGLGAKDEVRAADLIGRVESTIVNRYGEHAGEEGLGGMLRSLVRNGRQAVKGVGLKDGAELELD